LVNARIASLKTDRSIMRHGKVFHSYIGGCSVFITCVLLLVSLPSTLSCLRQRILGITPGVGFSDNPALLGHAVDTCSIACCNGEPQGALSRS
jgi:hypothetical protein